VDLVIRPLGVGGRYEKMLNRRHNVTVSEGGKIRRLVSTASHIPEQNAVCVTQRNVQRTSSRENETRYSKREEIVVRSDTPNIS
jgi:hypothetical protein